MSFSSIYTRRVLDPSFTNWKRRYAGDSIRVHKAHLVMLAERAVIPRDAVVAIRSGIEKLEKEFRPPARIPDGVEDLYFLFEQELSRLIGPDLAGYLHTARSRNDMDTTIFRLALFRALVDFLSAVSSAGESILEKAEANEKVPIVLFTHGQPANVSTLAHYLTAFLNEALEGARLFVSAARTVDRSTLGACAITTTGFDIDPVRVSELLGMGRPVENSYRAISTSHWLTYPASACASLMTDVTRFAADLIHKASSEVGMLEFPDDLVQVSSIMPQKRNPVILEHLRIQAGLARGKFEAVGQLFSNVPFQDVNEVADAPVELLYEGLSLAGSAVDLLAETVRGLGVNGERCREIAVKFGTTTTELADTLVREAGISFRGAHGVTQAYVRSGYRIDALRRSFRELTGGELTLTDARIHEVLSPEWFVAVRRVPGGPAPEGMRPVYEAAAAGIDECRSFVSEMRKRERSASEALNKAFAAL